MEPLHLMLIFIFVAQTMKDTLHFNINFKCTFKYLADIFIQQDKWEISDLFLFQIIAIHTM